MNTPGNWVRIIGTLLGFYVFQGLHWWANFELGVNSAQGSTYYNLIIFATAVFCIGLMLMQGAEVNNLKLTHEFYMEKISEEKQRQKDIRDKQAQKARDASKKAFNA